jgi:signal peptidase I
MVEPMPPTSAGGDPSAELPPPPFLVPPGYESGPRSAWTSSPARPVSVAPALSELPMLPPGPSLPTYLLPAAAFDPTADLDSWGPLPPAPPEPPAQRSLLRVLWPWGVRGVLESVEVLLLALVMFTFVRAMGQNFVVDGGSMEPTFHNGEMLIVNKIVYRSFDISWLPWSDNKDWRPFGAPRPGDVVVFQFPQNPSRDFIKRVIAVEGQTVEVRGGKLLIDGKVMPEPFLSQPPAYDYGPAKVPAGQYFVLGDNRNNSYDSHAWGMLDNVFMIGRAELRYWPPERAGRVGNDDPSPAPQAGVSRSP